MSDFHGKPTIALENAHLQVELLADTPRLVRLRLPGGDNLLAEVPDFTLETTEGLYRFWGGHRLWHAPESIPRTYIPDDASAVLETFPAGARLSQHPEPLTGIAKTLEVRLDPDRPRVTLDHTLHNAGNQPVQLAAWAVTMLPLGGVAILPQAVQPADSDALLPNRNLSLWSYTRLADPRLHLADDFILVQAAPAQPPLKIGCFNPHGWCACWRGGVLFRKSYDVHPGAPHPDGNCNTEIYCGDRLIELESLGALVTLQPGESVDHRETWDLYDSLEQPFIPPALASRVQAQM